MYRYTSYKFGFGYYSGEFTLEDTSLEVTANMENQAPTVVVTEENGQSFRRVVNITGSAHDGQLANSYQTDELAQWDQGATSTQSRSRIPSQVPGRMQSLQLTLAVFQRVKSLDSIGHSAHGTIIWI